MTEEDRFVLLRFYKNTAVFIAMIGGLAWGLGIRSSSYEGLVLGLLIFSIGLLGSHQLLKLRDTVLVDLVCDMTLDLQGSKLSKPGRDVIADKANR